MKNISVDNAIKIINEAINDTCWDGKEVVVVDVPVTGEKTCKAIREHFENEGWIVSKEGIVGKVGSGDRWDPIHDEIIASRYTLKWW